MDQLLKGIIIFYIDLDMLMGEEAEKYFYNTVATHDELSKELYKNGYKAVFLKSKTGNGDRAEFMPLP